MAEERIAEEQQKGRSSKKAKKKKKGRTTEPLCVVVFIFVSIIALTLKSSLNVIHDDVRSRTPYNSELKLNVCL